MSDKAYRATMLQMALVLLTSQKMKEEAEKAAEPVVRDWQIDYNKKKSGTHKCNKCGFDFFGKFSRKYCAPCQNLVNGHLDQNETNQREEHPWYHPKRHRA